MNPAQPPEGILDPQQPYWPADKVGQATWLRLKGKLTGRRIDGLSENFTSYVNLGDADADRLIENIKKYGQYPQVNQNDKYGGAYNNEAYQKWLVEEFLEKPFRQQVDEKIESRVQGKKKEAPVQEDEPKEDEKEIKEQVLEITKELDKESSEEKTKQEEEQKDTEKKSNPDLSKIEDSLKNIKTNLSSQTAIVGAINNTNEGSIRTLGILQDIFLAQTDLIRKKDELKEKNEREANLERGSNLSGFSEATSTMDDGSAEAEVVKVDGDILTIKPIDGNFKEGQRIRNGGGGGFDLIGMIKSIAGKFGGGKAGPPASPTKLSKGGIALGPKKLADGGFKPGLYTKPTVGNLIPGQAVIPLNRNVGKKIIGGKKSAKIEQKYQPLADVMQQPIKAIGSAIVAMAGNVIRSMGALAGFFAPYITPLIGALGKTLGVPISVIESLLGGPAYAASKDLKQQTNIFADIWSRLMDTFGFSFGDDEKKKKTKIKQNPGKVIQGGDADFWMLAAVASLEGITPQGEADVAQSVYNRVASGAYGAKTIKDVLLSPGQYQPVTYDGADLEKWKAVADRESAIAAVASHKSKGIETATKYVDEGAANITNPQLQKNAAEFIGGRTDFAATSAYRPQPGAIGRVDRDGHVFGWFVGQGSIAYGKTNPGPSAVPAFPISAESGANVSQGKAVDAFTLSGPNSGYQVPGIGEMHGKEAVIQYQKGFTVLPIENRLFSMERDPLSTLARWQQLLGPSMSGVGRGSYAAGGKVTLYAGHADMTSDAPGGKGTNGGPKGDAPKIAAASGYFTNEAYLNDKIAAAAAAKSGGAAIYRSPIRTRDGDDANSNWTRAKNDAAAGNTPIEIHHDAESGKAGLIAKDQNSISANPFLKSVNNSFGFYRTGDEGFVKRGGAILEMDALKPHMRTNPSAWISTASTKLANAIKKDASNTPTDETESGSSSAPAEEAERPTNPIERVENALKAMTVGFAITKGFESGEITDKASYDRVREAAKASAAGISNSSTPPPAATAPAPTSQVVTSGSGEKTVVVRSGGSTRTVGKVLADMCVPNFG